MYIGVTPAVVLSWLFWASPWRHDLRAVVVSLVGFLQLFFLTLWCLFAFSLLPTPEIAELNLEGNYLHRLPEEIKTLLHLKAINLSKNKFRHFPEQLTALKTLETINLEENEISGNQFQQESV